MPAHFENCDNEKSIFMIINKNQKFGLKANEEGMGHIFLKNILNFLLKNLNLMIKII